ncbi:protein of unknown function [Hyphomicrobium sp. MC1]|nr:protein of unknown function [Hyphomicrobium sp. MC1]
MLHAPKRCIEARIDDDDVGHRSPRKLRSQSYSSLNAVGQGRLPCSYCGVRNLTAERWLLPANAWAGHDRRVGSYKVPDVGVVRADVFRRTMPDEEIGKVVEDVARSEPSSNDDRLADLREFVEHHKHAEPPALLSLAATVPVSDRNANKLLWAGSQGIQ